MKDRRAHSRLPVEVDDVNVDLQEGIALAGREHRAALVVTSTHPPQQLERQLLGRAAAWVLRGGRR